MLKIKTEKIVTFSDWNTKTGEFHFRVPCLWLDKYFEDTSIYEFSIDYPYEVENYEDKVKSYVEYRKESLYDKLSDKYYAADLLSYAIEDNVVQYCD